MQCKICHKEIQPGEEVHTGRCLPCFYAYLAERIEHIGDEDFEMEFDPEPEFFLVTFFKWIFKSIKNFFHKKA